MFNKNLKTKRGFSLVELMVVVAIMGTLAAIAIPAYNEYRKTAKKGAYKADLVSLHKGWLAFGVELDNFCQRETAPDGASIGGIGMVSLYTSKLYGSTTAANASCVVTGAGTSTPTPSGCSLTGGNNPCTGCSLVTGGTGTVAWTPYSSGSGPGKANFIGFSAEGCSNLNNEEGVVVRDSNTTKPSTDPCTLDEADYEMGVYGHLSGAQWHSAKIEQTGVFTDQGDDIAADSLLATCSS